MSVLSFKVAYQSSNIINKLLLNGWREKIIIKNRKLSANPGKFCSIDDFLKRLYLSFIYAGKMFQNKFSFTNRTFPRQKNDTHKHINNTTVDKSDMHVNENLRELKKKKDVSGVSLRVLEKDKGRKESQHDLSDWL